MNIQKTSNINFNAMILPEAIVYDTPVPAIIRTVTEQKNQFAPVVDTFIKSATPINLPKERFFYPHEAILSESKIKVVGLGKKIKPYFSDRNLKGAGRKIVKHIWNKR